MWALYAQTRPGEPDKIVVRRAHVRAALERTRAVVRTSSPQRSPFSLASRSLGRAIGLMPVAVVLRWESGGTETELFQQIIPSTTGTTAPLLEKMICMCHSPVHARE
jgi:hypothetical protein